MEDIESYQFVAAVGAFKLNVLGSAKGWAGAFLYNPKAKKALETFFQERILFLLDMQWLPILLS